MLTLLKNEHITLSMPNKTHDTQAHMYTHKLNEEISTFILHYHQETICKNYQLPLFFPTDFWTS